MSVDSEMWNHFIIENGPKSGLFLQSYEWGEFQQSLGRKVIRVLEDEFAAQIIKMPLVLDLCYLYIPKGPILAEFPIPNSQFPKNCHSDPDGRSGEESRGSPKDDPRNIILNSLRDVAKKENAIFVRFEPEKMSEGEIEDLNLTQSRDIQPRRTLILNLEKSFDDLLGGMQPKTRYNIHLAERHGVEIRVGNGFGEFLLLLKETARRDEFHLHPMAYYKKMAEFFTPPFSPPVSQSEIGGGRRGLKIKLWAAKYKNQTIAANLIGYFGDTVTYLHGASSYNWRNLMAPHLLHWQVIKNAKIEGYKFYDFWGIDETKWPGVTRFKKGFGGEELNYPGTLDLPINKNLYKMYQLARKLKSLI